MIRWGFHFSKEGRGEVLGNSYLTVEWFARKIRGKQSAVAERRPSIFWYYFREDQFVL